MSVLLGATGARAAEVTRVVSALDDENRFDLNLTVAWLHESRRSFVKREDENQVTPDGSIGLVKDLQYAQRRDILDMRMDFGVLWDVGFHVALPLVLGDDRSLNFDQSAGSCIFPEQAVPPVKPNCVNASDSTILSSGILPHDTTASPNTYGLNSGNGRPFEGPSSSVFRGPTRRGFESLNLGLTWAVFNQRRDDTRPTWTLSFDAKLDVFKDMDFNSANPSANTAVGLGYHQFLWSTFVSKRFRYFEPYFGGYYMLPVRTNGSIYSEIPNGNQGAVNPQQSAGVIAGVEQIAWENPRAAQRVTVEVRGHMDQRFFGRSMSEIWEPLRGSQPCMTFATEAMGCRPGIDNNPGQAFNAHPGVTETQAYASFGGDAGLNIQVGKYVRFRGLFGLTLNQPHYITYASAGVDRDGKNGVNLADPKEANANYRDSIDNPGRRFKVENSQVWSLFLQGSLMF